METQKALPRWLHFLYPMILLFVTCLFIRGRVVSPVANPNLKNRGFLTGFFFFFFFFFFTLDQVYSRHQSATPTRQSGDAPLRRVIPARGLLRVYMSRSSYNSYHFSIVIYLFQIMIIIQKGWRVHNTWRSKCQSIWFSVFTHAH